MTMDSNAAGAGYQSTISRTGRRFSSRSIPVLHLANKIQVDT